MKVVIKAQDLHRYVVGARAGQTLTVSVGTDKASLRMITDATVTEGINNFAARLPKNGDYVFEVQNIAETDLQLTLNVKIQ